LFTNIFHIKICLFTTDDTNKPTLTNLLSYFLIHGADLLRSNLSALQEFHSILWNPKVHYRIQGAAPVLS